MATLIEYRKADGTIIGRCDAKCYNATGSTCHCICAGRNHGTGLGKALEQRPKIRDGLLRKKGNNFLVLYPIQGSLFRWEKTGTKET